MKSDKDFMKIVIFSFFSAFVGTSFVILRKSSGNLIDNILENLDVFFILFFISVVYFTVTKKKP